MAERLIVVTAGSGHRDTILAMADKAGVRNCQVYALGDPPTQHAIHLLVGDDNRQAIIDDLQAALGGSDDWRLTILPVEATIPRLEEKDDRPQEAARSLRGESREELYTEVAANARLDPSFFIFVVLSTVVAAIGLVEDNVAVVIGAMVIAPMLGPNLAFGLGVALGDQALMGRALLINLAGVTVTLAICIAIGLVWPLDLGSEELMARTDVGFAGMALALASGAAAALSLSSGLSSALVGVMVAVALLPPAATIGLMLGDGHPQLALGAALLLAVNVICVNLSAQIVFVLRGVTPRTWIEKEKARRAVRINAGVWLVLLAAMAALLYYRTPTL